MKSRRHDSIQQETQKTLPTSGRRYLDIEARTREFYRNQGFTNLTNIQAKSLPVVCREIDSILIAPTGSGKTEAAILPVLTMIRDCNVEKSKGIKALYITPLRSLNNDVFRRIEKYASCLGLRLEIRHGDTSAVKKKKMSDNPPDVLITTPETLGIILTNSILIGHLASVQWIIIDEVHELLPNERGSHLSVSLERLEKVAKKRPSRIGLSASVSDPLVAGKFVAGSDRNIAVLMDRSMREYDIDIKYVNGSINDACQLILTYVEPMIDQGKSILVFTNTRDEAEYIGTILKSRASFGVDVHHGSLSKTSREETEKKLREGSAGLVVCTSSLELGLDIGSIDLVVHYGSPRQISKLVQRIGRSRHNNRKSARGLIITNTHDDELEAHAILYRTRKGEMEEQEIHQMPLDVMAHHLVGISLQARKSIQISEAFQLIRKSYPFRNLQLSDLIMSLKILADIGLIRIDITGNSYRYTLRSYKYYFSNLSMIPFVQKFEVIDIVAKRKIGMLDQQFVGDYGERGNVFVLKGLQWKIVSIDEKRLVVNVEPLRGVTMNVPYWAGETIPVDYLTAARVAESRRHTVNSDAFFSRETVTNSLVLLKRLPDAKLILIENSRKNNTLILHMPFGTKANNTFASVLSTLLSSQLGYVIESRSDAYRILLTSAATRIGRAHIERIFSELIDCEPILVASFTGTYVMNWKVWTVGRRFGIVSKESVYDKKIARLLYDRYMKTPVSAEAIRELIHEKYDVFNTNRILHEFASDTIRLQWVEVEEFSELAKPIVDRYQRFSAAPLSLETGIIELVKERLLRTKHRLICIRCGEWERVFETKDVPDQIHCKKCRSRLITATYISDLELPSIIVKKLKGAKISADDSRKFDRAWKIASLINNFGMRAITVLSGHGIGADTAARVLRNSIDESTLYRSIYEAERQYVLTRGFWND
ncbi:MAG TPA: DEAD/DEAH box helicase [Nitrososphaeraceae archaeon]|nr:DEAD/DEAH box helicase [Nitrososphaeraceae archaeon]